MKLYHATPSATMPAILESGQLQPRQHKNKPSLIWMSESPELAMDYCQSWANIQDCPFTDTDEIEMTMIEIDSTRLDQHLLNKKISRSQDFDTGIRTIDSHWVYSDTIALEHCDFWVYDTITPKQLTKEQQ